MFDSMKLNICGFRAITSIRFVLVGCFSFTFLLFRASLTAMYCMNGIYLEHTNQQSIQRFRLDQHSSIECHVWVETIFIMNKTRITITEFLFSFKIILNAPMVILKWHGSLAIASFIYLLCLEESYKLKDILCHKIKSIFEKCGIGNSNKFCGYRTITLKAIKL